MISLLGNYENDTLYTSEAIVHHLQSEGSGSAKKLSHQRVTNAVATILKLSIKLVICHLSFLKLGLLCIMCCENSHYKMIRLRNLEIFGNFTRYSPTHEK